MLDCQLKTRLNSFNRLDHLDLLILKTLSLIFFKSIFFLFFATSHVVPNFTFSFFISSHISSLPWSILPMQYATIMPQHAIDKLWIADLDVNLFLWMQTFYQNMMQAQIFILWCKCSCKDADAELYFPMQNAPFRRCKCKFPWCKCPLQGCRCKVYSWWCKCLFAEMQMRFSIFSI